ncbi:MAG TPA: phosphatidylserine decarboxylase [bacterium]|nr:phosphatidylserine decarboxylase [bacterium]
MPETWSMFLPVFITGWVLLLAGSHWGYWFLALFGVAVLVVSFLILNFFRDFERAPGRALKPRQVISPADGKVVVIRTVTEKFHLKKPSVQVAIFMNPLNNHVQRAPFDGKVVKKVYHKGEFMAAYEDKADLVNEQAHLVVDLISPGPRPKKMGRMVLKQIAGLVCHRIRTTPGQGDRIERGKRIGRILLGSRVDVFMPKTFKPAVKVGDQVLAGVTVLGEL